MIPPSKKTILTKRFRLLLVCCTAVVLLCCLTLQLFWIQKKTPIFFLYDRYHSKDQDLYEALGLVVVVENDRENKVSHFKKEELRTAYYRMSRRYHPELNAHEPDWQRRDQIFIAASRAYMILQHNILRQIYDQYGYSAVLQHICQLRVLEEQQQQEEEQQRGEIEKEEIREDEQRQESSSSSIQRRILIAEFETDCVKQGASSSSSTTTSSRFLPWWFATSIERRSPATTNVLPQEL